MKKTSLAVISIWIIAAGCLKKQPPLVQLNEKIKRYADTARIYSDSALLLNDKDVSTDRNSGGIFFADSILHNRTQTVIRKANWYRGIQRGLEKAKAVLEQEQN